MDKVSIIIPVWNEEKNIAKSLQTLQSLRLLGHEVIVVDAGSSDNTPVIAHPFVDRLIIIKKKERATQQNIGAKQAKNNILLFLHADTLLPENAITLIQQAIHKKYVWGRFNVCFTHSAWIFRIIATLMNWRSCLTGIATGDQGIFVQRDVFLQLGGFAKIPLMEDIELSQRLKSLTRPSCLKASVLTSSRRWEQQGVIKTILLMWGLRLAYFMGVSPQRLSQYYKTFCR